MKKYEQTTTIITKNLDTNKEETTERKRKYIIKTWNELTDDEKEKEIENNKEAIYSWYQDVLYHQYKDEIDYIKEKYNNISFDDVYMDGCSQGSWIDCIKNFKCYYTIDIYGETIEVYDIDLHVRKYIDNINADNIEIYNYYIDDEKLQKIENTKKYKNWINNIIKDVNNFINDINAACKELIENEYIYPYNIHDESDLYYLNDYFYDNEFVYDI